MIALYHVARWRIYIIAANEATERGFMKTARENVSILKLRSALKRLLDEYEIFDTARRLCADYCITPGDIPLMIDGISKPKRSKSRLTSTIRSDKIISRASLDEVYLITQ